MRTIKANKTQLYELIKKYCPYELPKMKDTDFEKATRRDAYWLRFSDPEYRYVVVYCEMFCNIPTLRITCRSDEYDTTIRVKETDIKELVRESRREHVWTIRWTDNSGIDSCRGTEEEAERYAAEKCKELGKPGYILVE